MALTPCVLGVNLFLTSEAVQYFPYKGDRGSETFKRNSSIESALLGTRVKVRARAAFGSDRPGSRSQRVGFSERLLYTPYRCGERQLT